MMLEVITNAYVTPISKTMHRKLKKVASGGPTHTHGTSQRIPVNSWQSLWTTVRGGVNSTSQVKLNAYLTNLIWWLLWSPYDHNA